MADGDREPGTQSGLIIVAAAVCLYLLTLRIGDWEKEE